MNSSSSTKQTTLAATLVKKGNSTSKPFGSEKLFPSRSLLKLRCWSPPLSARAVPLTGRGAAGITLLLQYCCKPFCTLFQASKKHSSSPTSLWHGSATTPASLQLPSQRRGGSPSSVETFFFDDIVLQQQVTCFLPPQQHKRWSCFLVLVSFGCRAECFCYPYLGLLGIDG